MAMYTWALVLAAPFWAGGSTVRPAQLSPAAEAAAPSVPTARARRGNIERAAGTAPPDSRRTQSAASPAKEEPGTIPTAGFRRKR